MAKVIKSRKTANLLMTFFTPIAILTFIYVYMDFIPFGNKTILTWDLAGQYVQFFSYLHDCMTGAADWSYSLAGGIGEGTIGLFAYYLMSPFNVIMFFFNAATMPMAVVLLIFLKVGSIAVSMYLYLTRHEEGKLAIFFGAFYALSGFAVAYQSNVMWLDALIWLPIVVWGIEKIIEKGKCLQYILALALALTSNYYFGYMVCLFSVLYFGVYMLCMKLRGSSWKQKLITIGRYVYSSLLAGGLSAWILIPAFLGMQNSGNKNQSELSVIFNTAKLFYYRKFAPLLLSGTYDDSQRYNISGLPLLYCGLIIVIGIAAFLFSKNNNWRKKVMNMTLIGVLLYSINHMGMFLVWHGFYSPIGAPWRFIFIWTFIVLVTSYEGLQKVDVKQYWLSVFIFGLYATFVYWKFPAYRGILTMNMLWIIPQILILGGRYFDKARSYKWCSKIAFLLMIVAVGSEISYNSVRTWREGFQWVELKEYEENVAELEEFASLTQETEDGNQNYTRSQIEDSHDVGFMIGTNNISMYASTENQAMWDLEGMMGFEKPDFLSDYNGGSTMLVDDILGIRFMARQSNGRPGTEEILTQKGLQVLENQDALPIAFLVKKQAEDITIDAYEACMSKEYVYKDGEQNLFDIQNALYHALPGSEKHDVYKIVEISPNSGIAFDTERYYEMLEANQSSKGKITYLGSETYENYYGDGVYVYKENSNAIRQVVEYVKSMTKEVRAGKDSDITCRFANNDEEATYACFTVPYEKAWTAYVDGIKTETIKGMGGFLLVPVSAGEHEVRIVYHTEGLAVGIIITLLSAGALLIRIYVVAKSRKALQEQRITYGKTEK